MAGYESYDLDRIDVPEIDSKLLMELLDETYGADEEQAEDDGRLGDVMSSFEAEIGFGGQMVAGEGECSDDDGGLEDILSGLDGCDGSKSMTCGLDDPFDWVGMEVEDDVGVWFVEGEGIVGYGEMREYNVCCYGESSMEQVYSPLWG